MSGSREVYQICLALGSDISGHLFHPVAKSFSQTYLAGSLGSRDDHRTHLIPGSDMSGPSAFNPGYVPTPDKFGARTEVQRFFPVMSGPSPNMSGSLTPKQIDSL
jgi:hypothetical protein